MTFSNCHWFHWNCTKNSTFPVEFASNFMHSQIKPNVIFFNNVSQLSPQHPHQLSGCPVCAFLVDFVSSSLVFAHTHFLLFQWMCVHRLTLCGLLNHFQRWWKAFKWLQTCLHSMKIEIVVFFWQSNTQGCPHEDLQCNWVGEWDLAYQPSPPTWVQPLPFFWSLSEHSLSGSKSTCT